MKRISRILLGAIVALMPLTAAMSVSAASTCSIGYTGPDSNNMCTSQTTYTCTVQNNNTVEISNENKQVVASGTVTNSGNTQSGGSTSGQVTNTNGGVFNVSITNPSYGDKTCTAVATVPATTTPETPTTPTTPVTPVQPPVQSTPTALAETSGNSFGPIIATTLGALGAAALVSYLATRLYRRSKS